MLNVISKIFGGGDVIKQGMELVDSMHTSTEEEIAATNRARVNILDAYAPFKIAQRLLAVMFSFTFLSCFALVLGMSLAGEGDPDQARAVIDEFWIGEIMLTIVAFYFGGGAFEGAQRAKRGE